MKEYHFSYNGKLYNTGTVVIIKSFNRFGNPCTKEVSFMYQDVERERVIFKTEGVICHYPKDQFYNVLIAVADNIDNQVVGEVKQRIQKENTGPTVQDELNIDGLFIAWVWYIIIMVVSGLFNDRILAWTGASIIFFHYRKEKLRKAGFKK